MMQVTICYIFQAGGVREERIISLWEQKCLVNYLSSLSGDKHTPLKVDVNTLLSKKACGFQRKRVAATNYDKFTNFFCIQNKQKQMCYCSWYNSRLALFLCS